MEKKKRTDLIPEETNQEKDGTLEKENEIEKKDQDDETRIISVNPDLVEFPRT